MPRCPECNEITPSGCNCDVGDSDCFEITGAGSEASCYQVNPVVDPDTDSIFMCDSDGMGVFLPDAILSPPSCKVYKTTNTTVANNTLTFISFNAEYYDSDTMHSTSVNSNRITFTTAGVYIVNFVCAFNKDDDGMRKALIRKNGTDTLGADEKPTGDVDLIVGHSVIVIEEFSAADYVEAGVRHTAGGNLLLLAESYSPTFSATWLADT